MAKSITLLSLLGLGLTLAAPLTSFGAPPADDYPYQGRAGFTLDGTVAQVDTDRDRVIVTGDAGRRYTLDTYQAQITLRDRDQPGATGDLIPGMRLRVTGTLLSRDIVEADRVTVLPLKGARPVVPADIPGDSINLRGTVETTDERQGSFVVHVNSHARTVVLKDGADLQGVPHDRPDRMPFERGDRVTVSGVLRDDGSVLADRIVLGHGSGDGSGPVSDLGRTLTGRVSSRSNRYVSRDIKVRMDGDREVKVHVPGGIPVRRDGQPISVHDLDTGDEVRITGTPDGEDFKASRIDAVRPVRDEGD